MSKTNKPKSGAVEQQESIPTPSGQEATEQAALQTSGSEPITFSSMLELNAFINKLLDQKTEELTRKLVEQVQMNQSPQVQPIVIRKDEAVKKASNKGRNTVFSGTDDVLDTPAVFYAFSVGLSIWDDTKFGKIDPNPMERPVEFTHIAGVRLPRKANEKEDNIVNVSRVTIRSKSEAEWLRNHSKFNVLFFERMPDVSSNIDYDDIRDKTEAGNIVDQMSSEEIIMRYKQLNGGKALNNIADMRVFLYESIAAQNKKNREASKRNAVQNYIDALPEGHEDKNAKIVGII